MEIQKKGIKSLKRFSILVFMLSICFSTIFTLESKALESQADLSGASSAYFKLHGARIVSAEDELILKAYEKDQYDAYLDKRKARAEELLLDDEVDGDYFLKPSFFQRDDWYLFEGIDILIPYESTPRNTGIMLLDNLTEKSGIYSADVGIRWSYSYWKINDGRRTMNAFCADYYGADPDPAGKPAASAVLELKNGTTKHNRLRQVAYYGYGGYKDMLTSKYGTSKAIVISNLLASYANGITPESKDNPSYWSAFRSAFDVDAFFKQALPPENFKAFLASFNKKDTNIYGNLTLWQPLLYGYLETRGNLVLEKSSSLQDISSNNHQYDLSGAIYGLYQDSACTKLVQDLTIKADGKSEVISLETGTYYLKEKKAPLGYLLDSKAYAVTIYHNQTNTKKLTDQPTFVTLEHLLKKEDFTNKNKLSLKDAQFKVEFLPNETAAPLKTWILKSDELGYVDLNSLNFVEGDDFYLDIDGNPVLPLGYLRIQEIKPPLGYQLNEEVIVVPTSSLEMLTVKDQPNELKIIKKQKDKDLYLSNVTFIHTFPDGKKETLKTNSQGEIVLSYLVPGVHSLQETSTNPLFILDKTIRTFEVGLDGSLKENVLIIENEARPYDFYIDKVNQFNSFLDGAIFGLYDDKDCTSLLDRQETKYGYLTFRNLVVGKDYYIKELKAPKAHQLNDHIFHLICSFDDALSDFVYQVDGEVIADNSIKVENQAIIELPETGSKSRMYLYVMLFALLILIKKGERK